MNERFMNALNMGKMKTMGIVGAATLMLSLGSLSVYAASNWNNLNVTLDENGVKYSTDDGQTWGIEVPDGVTVSVGENKETIVFVGNQAEGNNDDYTVSTVDAKEDASNVIHVKAENNKVLYSADGGKTWNETVPDGIVIEVSIADTDIVGAE